MIRSTKYVHIALHRKQSILVSIDKALKIRTPRARQRDDIRIEGLQKNLGDSKSNASKHGGESAHSEAENGRCMHFDAPVSSTVGLAAMFDIAQKLERVEENVVRYARESNGPTVDDGVRMFGARRRRFANSVRVPSASEPPHHSPAKISGLPTSLSSSLFPPRPSKSHGIAHRPLSPCARPRTRTVSSVCTVGWCASCSWICIAERAYGTLLP